MSDLYAGEVIAFNTTSELFCESCWKKEKEQAATNGEPIGDEEYATVDEDEDLEAPFCSGCGRRLRAEVAA